MLGMKYMGKNQKGQGGTIVNIASILGLNTIAGCPVYCGTKHAVVGLTKSYAVRMLLSNLSVKTKSLK